VRVSVPTDLLLVQRAAGGDVGAFEMLVRRYQLGVFRLCVRMLEDRQAAEDAAQDVFLVAWRSMGRFRGEAKFSTWLYRIATNRCLRELRRRRAPTVELPEGLAATEGVPHLVVEAAEGLAAVGAAMGRLSLEQRVALLLREVEGLSYDQIAEVLGVSVAAVKSRIYRARVEVARDLGARNGDRG
jgi:RNA polymerase sigma-70 factor, ECF subfamily